MLIRHFAVVPVASVILLACWPSGAHSTSVVISKCEYLSAEEIASDAEFKALSIEIPGVKIKVCRMQDTTVFTAESAATIDDSGVCHITTQSIRAINGNRLAPIPGLIENYMSLFKDADCYDRSIEYFTRVINAPSDEYVKIIHHINKVYSSRREYEEMIRISPAAEAELINCCKAKEIFESGESFKLAFFLIFLNKISDSNREYVINFRVNSTTIRAMAKLDEDRLVFKEVEYWNPQ